MSRKRNNPLDWKRDEIILVAAAVAANGWKKLRTNSSEAIQLSDELRARSECPTELRSDRFRSPGAVSRKSSDFLTALPTYERDPTKGGGETFEVAKEFMGATDGLAEEAARIRSRLPVVDEADKFESAINSAGLPDSSLIDMEMLVFEGSPVEKSVALRERSPGIRNMKIKAVLDSGDDLSCEACGFNFERSYGARGTGYIEVHHRIPLHISGRVKTSLADLALLCSNCHRMIHHESPWLTVERLSAIVEEQIGNQVYEQ